MSYYEEKLGKETVARLQKQPKWVQGIVMNLVTEVRKATGRPLSFAAMEARNEKLAVMVRELQEENRELNERLQKLED